jgi:hypothetical protein
MTYKLFINDKMTFNFAILYKCKQKPEKDISLIVIYWNVFDEQLVKWHDNCL